MSASKGTPLFSAPELLNHDHYDESVDVWSLGCVLVCLYADCASPYGDSTAPGFFSLVAKGKVVPELEAEHNSLSGSLDHAKLTISACCSFDPELRPSAAQALEMLKMP